MAQGDAIVRTYDPPYDKAVLEKAAPAATRADVVKNVLRLIDRSESLKLASPNL
jgi:hypothetical protein